MAVWDGRKRGRLPQLACFPFSMAQESNKTFYWPSLKRVVWRHLSVCPKPVISWYAVCVWSGVLLGSQSYKLSKDRSMCVQTDVLNRQFSVWHFKRQKHVCMARYTCRQSIFLNSKGESMVRCTYVGNCDSAERDFMYPLNMAPRDYGALKHNIGFWDDVLFEASMLFADEQWLSLIPSLLVF